MPGMPNYDYDVEQNELLRRMKIAQAMQEGSLQPLGPTEVVGGVAVKRSPLELISKVAQAYLGGRQASEVSGKQAALGERYRGDLKKGVADLVEGLSAQAGQPTEVNDESGGHSGPGMTGDQAQAAKRTAILNAIGSNIAPVQQIGSSMLSSMVKQDQMTPKDWLALADKFDPESVVAAQRAGNSALLKPKAGHVVANNQIYTTTGGNVNPQPTVDARDKFGPVGTLATGPNGPIVGQFDTGTGKANFAPAGTHVKVTANATSKGEGRFMEKLGEESAGDIVKARQAKVDSQRQIQSMSKLEQLDKQGVFSGPTAKPAMVVGSLAEAMGFPVDKAKLANSQAYQGELMANMQNFLTGSLARSTTDKDAEILQAPLPMLLNSPEGRAALRRQVVARAQEKIQYADQVEQNLLQKFPEAARLISVTPGNPSPGVPQRSDVNPGGPVIKNW